jgi:hypothetical protein
MERLRSAVAEGGTEQALDVCSIHAQAVTESLAVGMDVTLRRVSERYRNPADAPDANEREVLQRFAQDGAPADTVFVVQPGALPDASEQQATYRYMRAIRITKPLCLKCHGRPEKIDPTTLSRLAELYPEDRATGYAFRDLRGAFSVTIPASVVVAADSLTSPATGADPNPAENR